MPFPSVTTTAGRVVTFKRTTGPRYVHLCIGRFSGCPMWCACDARELVCSTAGISGGAMPVLTLSCLRRPSFQQPELPCVFPQAGGGGEGGL